MNEFLVNPSTFLPGNKPRRKPYYFTYSSPKQSSSWWKGIFWEGAWINQYKSKQFLFLWLFALLFNIITFFLIFFKNGLKGSHVALKYNVRAGILWYGQGANLYWLPVLGLAILALNYLIFKKLASSQTFLLYALCWTSILVQFLILANVLLLANIN